MAKLPLYRCFHVCFCSLMLAGCGGPAEPTRTSIAGKVTYNGTPIADGEVAFVPEKTSNSAPGAGIIKGGAYSLKGNGGLMAGKYKVEFRAFTPSKTSEAEGSPARPIGSNPRDQILKDKFNLNSTEQIEVNNAKPITKDFELKD